MRRQSSWVSVLTLGLVLGAACKPDSPPASNSLVSGSTRSAATGDSAPALKEKEPLRIQVSADLLRDGRISLVKAEAADLRAARPLPGEVTLSAEGEAEVGSLVAGRIARIEVNAGDLVTKGQTLAWVDAPEVGAARAELERVDAQYRAAERRLERQRTLQKDGATSQGALDEAEASLNIAQADRKALNLRLRALGAESDSAQANRVAIRAPISGVISERTARLGMSTSAQLELFHIVNPAEMRVQARWPETAGTPPKAGTQARLVTRRRSDGTNATCDAKVVTQFGRVESATRSVTLSLLPSKTCQGLAPGGYLDVYLEPSVASLPGNPQVTTAASGSAVASAPDSAVLVRVPRAAIVDVRGLATVFVSQGEAGSFVARAVVPQVESASDVLLESGVEVGEQVVVRGTIYLKGELLRDSLGGD